MGSCLSLCYISSVGFMVRLCEMADLHLPSLLCPSQEPRLRISFSSCPLTTLNHSGPSAACFHPSITSGIWPLTQLPAPLGGPGLAPGL
jgi:hypothetical protein